MDAAVTPNKLYLILNEMLLKPHQSYDGHIVLPQCTLYTFIVELAESPTGQV